MGNIIDYLEKYNYELGAISPFNYIDAFVFAVFAYLPVGEDMRDYTGFSFNADRLRIKDVCDLLIENPEILKNRYEGSPDSLKDYRKFIEAISNNIRYRNVEIVDFTYENEEDSQFACYVFDLTDNYYCISYRGTDGTYAGWYENFMLLDETTKAQVKASQTLMMNLEKFKDSTFYLTGHSKGGNLSAFAALDLYPIYGKRICKAYNFDGPGFNKNFLENYQDNIELLKESAFGFFIENSVVGELLFGQHEIYGDDLFYIKAQDTINILWQHSPFLWDINCGDFDFCHQSFLSSLLNKRLDNIIETTPPERMKEAIEMFFKTLKVFKSNELKKIELEIKSQGNDNNFF